MLIDKNGVLKIANFGLANFYPPKHIRSLTNRVVTLWYRALELLLGSTDYGVGVVVMTMYSVYLQTIKTVIGDKSE